MVSALVRSATVSILDGCANHLCADEVHFLPFWENGVKFFTIEGPNKEKVEFSQYL